MFIVLYYRYDTLVRRIVIIELTQKSKQEEGIMVSAGMCSSEACNCPLRTNSRSFYNAIATTVANNLMASISCHTHSHNTHHSSHHCC